MAHKKANSLELSDIRVKYNKNDGSLRITSKDPDLKGKAFSLTVTSNSSSAKTLFELMRENGLVVDNAIPTSLTVNSKTEFDSFYDRENPLKFKLGETYNSAPVDFDLQASHNVLIGGGVGSGRSLLLRSLVKQTMLRDDFHLTVFDPTRIEWRKETLRDQDCVLNTTESLVSEIFDLEEELQSRWKIMENAGVNYFGDLNTALPYRILVLDSISHFLNQDGDDELTTAKYDFAKQLLFKMMHYGWIVGIHFVISSSQIDAEMLPAEVLSNTRARIITGSTDYSRSLALLGEKPVYGHGVLNHMGRGVIKDRAGQTPLQMYFIPDELD